MKNIKIEINNMLLYYNVSFKEFTQLWYRKD